MTLFSKCCEKEAVKSMDTVLPRGAYIWYECSGCGRVCEVVEEPEVPYLNIRVSKPPVESWEMEFDKLEQKIKKEVTDAGYETAFWDNGKLINGSKEVEATRRRKVFIASLLSQAEARHREKKKQMIKDLESNPKPGIDWNKYAHQRWIEQKQQQLQIKYLKE